MPATATAAPTIRALAPADLDAVVALDAAAEGQSRRGYVERRLRAAQREPALHAQFAAVDGDGTLVGFMLGRVLAGEFGRRERGLRLEAMGVRADRRGAGVGAALLEALTAWARRHGVDELRTAASWRDGTILAWLAAQRFELAPDVIVDCAVGAFVTPDARHDVVALDAGEGPGGEIDYGRGETNDHERYGRGGIAVQAMTTADLDAIVRIDRGITGRDRREYIAARFAESRDDTAVRLSLAARIDGAVVGYLMARADLGDFGRTSAVAIIDTIGVDPDVEQQGVGRAMLAELFANLGALRVERVETVVAPRDIALLGFLYAAGFRPAQRLSFVRRLQG